MECHYLRSFFRLFIFRNLLGYGKTSNYVSSSYKDIISFDLSSDCSLIFDYLTGVLYSLKELKDGRFDLERLN